MRRIAGVLFALAASTCARPEPDGRCAVTLEVQVRGRAAYSLVRVLDSRGKIIPLRGLLCRGLGLEEKHAARAWHVLPGRAGGPPPPARGRDEGGRATA